MIDVPRTVEPLILRGDCRDVLRQLPSESVHCVVTSPPYWGLRDYTRCGCVKIPAALKPEGGLARNERGADPACPHCRGTGRTVDPAIWGGDPSCQHAWVLRAPRRERHVEDVKPESTIQMSHEGSIIDLEPTESCRECDAWRGSLGLEPTPELYVQHLVEVVREVRRVLRTDGVLWLNIGDTYSTHPAWFTGEKRWKASGLGGASDKTGMEQAGAVDKRLPNIKEKDLVGIPWMTAFALRADGWYWRAHNVWAKPNCMPESAKDRTTRSHEEVFMFSRSASYYYDNEGRRNGYAESSVRRISQATFDDQDGGEKDYGHGSNRGIRKTLENFRENAEDNGGANLRDVWWIPTASYSGAHYAVFPDVLVENCVMLGTSQGGACSRCGAPYRRVTERRAVGTSPPRPSGEPDRPRAGVRVVLPPAGAGADRAVTVAWVPSCACDAHPGPCIVLDPFAGSGTTLAVARRLGRASIGIDLNPEYVEQQQERPEVSSYTLDGEW